MVRDIICDYLNNGYGDEKVLLNIIDITKKYPNQIKYLCPYIKEHYYQMQKEALNFYNILNSDINLEYKKIKAYKNIPYKNKFNLHVDVKLFSLIDKNINQIHLYKDNLKYKYLLEFLLKKQNCKLELINDFFKIYNISYLYFYEDPKIFEYNMDLYDEYVLKKSFNDLYRYNNDYENYSSIVGLYAEYLEYLKLLNNDGELIWVSRECGDGFGYDFMIYDKTYDIANCFEVKGTVKKKKMDKFKLSKNEFNKYVYFNDNFDSIRTRLQIDNLLVRPYLIREEHNYGFNQIDKYDYMNSSTGEKRKVKRVNSQLILD